MIVRFVNVPPPFDAWLLAIAVGSYLVAEAGAGAGAGSGFFSFCYNYF
jgi:hypothetical protein